MQANSKHVNILVIDDEPFMLKVLTQTLGRIGYERVTARNTAQAGLDLLSQGDPIDLIVLDLNLPGMDGIEFIRRLVRLRYAGSLVLVSGEDERVLESAERLVIAHNLHSLGRLSKPVNAAVLAHVIGLLSEPTAPRSHTVRGPARLASQLREALTRGELIGYYQPKVSLATREVLGVECLLRWQHPQGKLISPDQFIPLAEQHGLVGDVTRRVLDVALNQARAWRAQGLPLCVAVNVTMSDLLDLEFPDVVSRLAMSYGVEPSAITLEVTESQVMLQLSTVLDVLARLRLKRFRLAIDDFGTGHSSLAQLRDLPFDELKIDRGFVHGISSNATLRAICNASLRMAHQLRMDVVAEGIEDAADWQMLRDIGCEAGQGYFIARPMPPEEIADWMGRWTARYPGTQIRKA